MNEDFERRETEVPVPPEPDIQEIIDRLEATLPVGSGEALPPETFSGAPEDIPPVPAAEEVPAAPGSASPEAEQAAPAAPEPPAAPPAPEASGSFGSARGEDPFPRPREAAPQPGNWNEGQPRGFYQGNGYYAPPAQGPGSWQGPTPPPRQGQPGGWSGTTPGWQQAGYYPSGGWQQPPQQPQQPWGGRGGQWQWTGTGWTQPAPPPGWQQGGYQPQQPGRWQSGSAPKAPEEKKKKKRGGFFRVLGTIVGVLLVLAGVSMAGYGIYAAVTGENPLNRSGFLPPVSSGGNSVPDVSLRDKPGEDTGDGSGSGALLSNTEIYKKVSPSVVAIVSRYGSGMYGSQGQGSGIILSEDGYIITNAHLTTDADNFEVVLPDGESYRAELVGSDVRNDLAVLKVNATGLPSAEFGNSDQTEVGERVCVIGNPGGLRFQNSLTVGYVSALNRSVYINNYTINCIQTDAAINPGNSGGPLINAYGQVIGISSAKIALEEYEGICFAIPISEAMPIVRQLISDGKVTGRAMLGITASAVRATEAEFYEIPLGLWVQSVTPGSDIARKGIREGDIITHIAGQPVYSLDACSAILAEYAPGDTVEIAVFRREGSLTDKTFTVEIVLESS